MAVILQDFVRYDLTARENIGIGRASDIENAPANVHDQIVEEPPSSASRCR